MTNFDWLSIVVPAKNEEDCVVEVLSRLQSCFPGADLMLVDNGSTDRTQLLAQSVEGVRIIVEPTPGKGAAMRKGAAAARRPWLLFHDADVEYSPEDAVAVALLAQQIGGMAVGARLTEMATVKASSWLANWAVRCILSRRFNRPLTDILTGTRALPTKLFVGMNTVSPGFGIETEITRKILELGYPLEAAPVRYKARSLLEGKKIRFHHIRYLLREAFKGAGAF